VHRQVGVARFQTTYPGWYMGRAVHFHFKVKLGSDGAAAASGLSALGCRPDSRPRAGASPASTSG